MGIGTQIALAYAAMMKLAWPSVLTRFALLGLTLALLPSCQAPLTAETKSQVLVLGMIHQGHVDSEDYGIDVVQGLVRDFDPDFMLVEIPPERMPEAMSGFLATGELTEERAKVFPEYRDAIFPLLHEMDFEIVGCAGWTKEMAVDRQAKLARWVISRPDQTAEVNAAQALADETQEAEGLNTLLGIHTARYDDLVKQGMEPYDRHFNDDLGLGGWTNINAAHYRHIADALDQHRGEGLRFIVTFGAWHKYWFLEQLRERDDVELIELADVISNE